MKDGEVPTAYAPAFETHLTRSRIFMDKEQGRSFISEASKALCESLLLAKHGEPEFTQFPLSKSSGVLNRFHTRNEYRIFRDITPLLVPSAELLFFCGDGSLDLTLLLDTWERATLFTDIMYFPFLLCEAKSGDQPIDQADRRNAQSGSMAVNAIIQLYRWVLAFSVSHNNELVRIYVHYAVVEEAMESFFLDSGDRQGRKRTYDFVREVYHKFYPEHLKRIQDALAAMDDPRVQSITSRMSLEDGRYQELANTPQKGEMALLREQLAQQESRSKEQMAEQERQMAEQERQSKEQMALLERQMAQQEKQYKEQIEMLKQLLNQR
ncbi:hypothetical protein V8E54_008115 [Elaphomyces granulatus]